MRLNGALAAAVLAFSAFTICATEIPAAEPESVGMSAERLLRINAAMQRQIDAGHIQGAVTAVARRGKLVHFEIHGLMDVEAERPMAPDALFIMMSSTKPVLGVAAMMMIEEGLIRPSDPVSKYIPEFADPQVAVLKELADEDIIPERIDWQNIPEHRLVPAQTEITIQHLLTHTSGLASGGLGSAAAYGQEPERDTLAGYIPTLGTMALDFHPGTRWAYSGAHGLDVVARIIEIVSDMPYQDFVQTRILDPLQMHDTHYNLPPEKESRRVAIKDRDPSRWTAETTYFSGSYGLTSTAKDYLHFQQMLASGGELFGQRLLSPRSVAMFGSNHVGGLYRGMGRNEDGLGYGYTVSVVLDPIAADSRRGPGAFGWQGAFGTMSWTDPAEEIAAVLMVQQYHAPTHHAFENAIRQAIID